MDIIIWGSGDLGKCFLKLLDKAKYHIAAFVDSDIALAGKIIEGVPVISFEQLKTRLEEERICVLLALKNSYNILTVLTQLENLRIDNIGILKPRVVVKDLPILLDTNENDGEIIWVKKEGKKYDIIPRLELNIVDGCNLNCKACSHFSSLFKRDSIYPIEEYQKDLIQVRKLGKLVRLRLLGGEPLLADNLAQYLSIARSVFPEADIELVTNGLLIPRIKQEIFYEIESDNISVVISPYLPTLRIKEQIENILNKFNIYWRFDGTEIQTFSRNLTLKKEHDDRRSSENCIARGCTFLRNGQIYKCPLEGLVSILETKYNVQFDCIERGIDIYDQERNIYDNIMKTILEPVEMCQYCSEINDNIKWEIVSKPILQDWLWNEGM